MVECESIVIVHICVKHEKCVDVNMLAYKMQVRLGESLWSTLVKLPLEFLSFYTCTKECDITKWAKHCISARPAPQPCVSVLMVRGIEEFPSLLKFKM